MTECAGFSVEYRSSEHLPKNTDSWWDHVLGVAQFGRPPADSVPLQVPAVNVALPPLAEQLCTCEIWRAPGPMRSGRIGAVQYRATSQLLFGCVVMPESGPLSNGHGGPSPLERTTSQAYAEIFKALDALGYPQLVRIWNYVAAINQAASDGERYWQFNSARQESFLQRAEHSWSNVPAASALGSAAGNPLVIYFIASTSAMRTIENPRQVSAYRYPAKFGPRSPLFSRAAQLPETDGAPLLISGTASIVGYETLHPDNVAAQTRETLTNIDTLLRKARTEDGGHNYCVEQLSYKVYVRHPTDLPAISRELGNFLGAQTPIIFLKADICRRELLVEIEAVGAARPAAH
jgi:enamine deaminase RidA (YjgF/YER057c/UK114 family)